MAEQTERLRAALRLITSDFQRPTATLNPHLGQAFRCRYCGGSWWEREEPHHMKWCPATIAKAALDG